MCFSVVTNTGLRAVPTPGSTMTTWTVSGGKYLYDCAMVSAPSSTSKGCTEMTNIHNVRFWIYVEHHALHSAHIMVLYSEVSG